MKILVCGTTRTMRRYAGNPYLGHLVTPRSREQCLHLPWACDNDAYSGFNAPRYLRMLARRHGTDPLFVTAPDVVANAEATLDLFRDWGPIIRRLGFRVALVGQDGLADVPWGGIDCLFLGGTTEWKLGLDAARFAAEAKRHGKHVHMGRVNSLRRLRYAYNIGCDTVDGTGYSRFAEKLLPKTLRFMERIHHCPPRRPSIQMNLFQQEAA